MKHRIYIDTSVFGGYFDEEFEEYSKKFFDKISQTGSIILLSNVALDEIEANKRSEITINMPKELTQLSFTEINFWQTWTSDSPVNYKFVGLETLKLRQVNFINMDFISLPKEMKELKDVEVNLIYMWVGGGIRREFKPIQKRLKRDIENFNTNSNNVNITLKNIDESLLDKVSR